jgi:transketolase
MTVTNTLSIPELEAKAKWVRRKTLEMAVAAGTGHVSTACSQMEILTALYFGGILRYDPANPQWPDRDQFILSKGQGGIGYYPILSAAGYFPEEKLDHFTQKGSTLGMHSENHTPGVEVLTGSLGHGLPIATGKARALKDRGSDALVYCMVGDGELQEGSNWEAMMTAAHMKLGNLIVIVDRNGMNTIGCTDGDTPRDGPGLGDLCGKFEAFGFDVRVVNGHDFKDILDVLKRESSFRDSDCAPTCIIANTKKGKGFSCMESRRGWHCRVPTGDDLKQCWVDLGVEHPPVVDKSMASVSGQAKHGAGKGMRDHYFDALFQHFKRDKNMVLISADNGAPSMDQFCDLKGQFFTVGIAEQQAAAMAAGLATEGKKVWVYAIAPFVTIRIAEFVKLNACAMNLPVHFVGVGASFSYDIMGPTHATVEDVSVMRCLPNLTIWSPSDNVTAAAVANLSVELEGPSYVRLDRGGLADLYEEGFGFRHGLSILRSGGSGIAIISTGAIVHSVLRVAEELDATVVDVFSIKPFNTAALLSSLGFARKIVVVEEHQLAGGLGSIVAETLADAGVQKPLLRIGVPDKFTFQLGGRQEILKTFGLDANSLLARIREWSQK